MYSGAMSGMALAVALSALWLARRSRRQVHRLAYDLRRSDLIVDLVEADVAIDDHMRTLQSLSIHQRNRLSEISRLHASKLSEMARGAERDVTRLRERIEHMTTIGEPTLVDERRLDATADEVRNLQRLAERINRETELLLVELEPVALV